MMKKTPIPSIDEDAAYRQATPAVQDFLYLKKMALSSIPKARELVGFENDSDFDQWLRETQNAVEGAASKTETCFVYKQFIARFRNGHSSVGCDLGYMPRYGFSVHVEQSLEQTRVMVRDVEASLPEWLIGAEIVSVAGLAIDEYFATTSASVAADSVLYAFRVAALLLPVPGWLEGHGIGDGESLAVGLKTANEVVPYRFSMRYGEEIQWKNKTPATVSFPKDDAFSYLLDEERSIAYLRIGHMLDRLTVKDGINTYIRFFFRPLARLMAAILFRQVKFTDYIDAFFGEVFDAGMGTIILDLRGNPGGDIRIAKAFLYYLEVAQNNPIDITRARFDSALARTFFDDDEEEDLNTTFYEAVEDPDSSYYMPVPKRRFDGQLLVLVNGGVASAGAFFATLIKDNGFGYLIGEPPAGLASGPTVYTPIYLPNSRWQASLATDWSTRPSGENERLIMPDCWLSPSLQDLQSNEDRLLAWARLFAAAESPEEKLALEGRCQAIGQVKPPAAHEAGPSIPRR